MAKRGSERAAGRDDWTNPDSTLTAAEVQYTTEAMQYDDSIDFSASDAALFEDYPDSPVADDGYYYESDGADYRDDEQYYGEAAYEESGYVGYDYSGDYSGEADYEYYSDNGSDYAVEPGYEYSEETGYDYNDENGYAGDADYEYDDRYNADDLGANDFVVETGEQVSPEASKVQTKSNAKKKSNRKKKKKTRKQVGISIPKPGTKNKKIDNTKLQLSATESLGLTLRNLMERQLASLPSFGVSLRSAYKRKSKLLELNRPLNLIRVIIMVLMGLCLAGRTYSWMTLGVMKGENAIYISLMLFALSVFVNWHVVYAAIRNLYYVRLSYEAYTLIASVFTAYEAYHMKNEATLLPLMVMALCACGIADVMDIESRARILKVALTADNNRAIRYADRAWDKKRAVALAGGGKTGFVRHLEELDLWHTWYAGFCSLLFVVVFILSVVIAYRTDHNWLTVFVLLLDIGAPVTLVWCCSKPFLAMVRSLKQRGTVAGWYGIKRLSGKRTVYMDDRTLFPKGTMRCVRVVPLAKITDSTLLSYAASLTLEANIGLNDAFIELMRKSNGSLMQVEGCLAEEGGARGIIHDDLVMVGSEHYMKLHGVFVPEEHDKYSLFVAVNGRMTGEFCMKYKEQQIARWYFRKLCRDHQLRPLVVSRNVYVNPAFLDSIFRAKLGRVTCPKTATRRTLSELKAFQNGAICGFVYRDGLMPYTDVIMKARSLHLLSAVTTGIAILFQVALILRTVSALLHGGNLVSGAVLVAFHLVFALLLELTSRLLYS